MTGDPIIIIVTGLLPEGSNGVDNGDGSYSLCTDDGSGDWPMYYCTQSALAQVSSGANALTQVNGSPNHNVPVRAHQPTDHIGVFALLISATLRHILA